MDIAVATAVVAGLFLVIGLAEPLAARMRLPYSVMLAILGIGLGIGAAFFLRTELTDALNPVAEAILGLPIRSNVFLYLFLPTLLFQVTLGLNLRRMWDDWVPILTLAIVAVVAATLSVGYALYWVGAMPLMACLLLGAIVSTTDPSAVVSIFRNIAAPQRLSRIVEGESLLNDAAAIALFGLFMGFVSRGVPNPTLGGALAQFPYLLAGGAVAGLVAGRVAAMLMGALWRFPLAQLSISVALPYLAYIGSEQIAGASGVIAVVTAGLTLNIVGPGRLTPAAWANLREVWDLLAHWAGALIFVLAALLIPRLLGTMTLTDLFYVGVVTAAALAARAAILFVLMPLLDRAGLSPHVERPYRVAILWGGLRGAVTLALALAVTESLRVPPDIRREVGIFATGFVLFTLMVQGTTLRWVITRLGLDRLSPLDAALANQVVAVAMQSVREQVSQTTETYDLTHETVRAEAKRFGDRLEEAVRRADDSGEILDRDRVTLGLIALAAAERELILARFREQAISNRTAELALADADRLIETTRTAGRMGYRSAARRHVGQGGVYRLAAWLHARLRLSAPFARMTADRFERLLIEQLVLRDLDGFIDARIRRIHGKRVANLLHDLLDSRAGEVRKALDGLRLQYPGYAEELERRFIRRTALRLEEREYETLREDGLIGPELHASLATQIARNRAQIERRPPLDLAVRKAELIRQMPLFAEMKPRVQRRLARALRSRYVQDGEVIVGRDVPARSVYFIASGAVEVRTAGQVHRLGRGEMFGQLAILSRRPRRSEVRAISHGVLLVLDEARFVKLLRASAPLRRAVRESAERRGVPLDALDSVVAEGAVPTPKAGPEATPPEREVAVTAEELADELEAEILRDESEAPRHEEKPETSTRAAE
ncbi:cation:proton antiporter domain-containing protein [Wenxinia marina]|uniref:Sodium/proton antiporter, CPA1 family n=1 Tax=Wenxinia marina DSM 24838 TaxID=1123501 RepID=A0A0D0NNE2_9RHOB|nr:cation:proton antiporter [Wenxinia marina]KIQ69755.1 sodium/proton antiporter, CPA1 family [Wenxinia marina DSM 24838]GGL60893.1 sodium:proton antiporter [Wenxinia marina]